MEAQKVKETRKGFTAALKECGITRSADYYELSWTIKKYSGVGGSKRKADMDPLELSKIIASEAIAYYLLNTYKPRTFDEIKVLCRRAARSVYQATEEIMDLAY